MEKLFILDCFFNKIKQCVLKHKQIVWLLSFIFIAEPFLWSFLKQMIWATEWGYQLLILVPTMMWSMKFAWKLTKQEKIHKSRSYESIYSPPPPKLVLFYHEKPKYCLFAAHSLFPSLSSRQQLFLLWWIIASPKIVIVHQAE